MTQLETPTTRRIVTFTPYPVKLDFRGVVPPVSLSKHRERAQVCAQADARKGSGARPGG